MEAPKKLKEEDVNKFNFTKKDIDYIIENANLSDIQERIFKRLAVKGRQSIVQISLGENISTATTNRIVRQIKERIKRLL